MSRSKRDIWKQLVDEAGEKEIEAAASVSVEQAEAELKAAGFDVAAERAKASAFLDELGKPGSEQAAPEPEPPRAAPAVGQQAPRARPVERAPGRSRPAVVWLAAAAVAVGVGSLVYVATRPKEPEAIGPVPPESAAPDRSASQAVTAEDWRRKAAVDCDAERWTACIADLDRARQLDPAGDDAPPVKATRAKAVEGRDKPPLRK
jgi:hypothetical protein